MYIVKRGKVSVVGDDGKTVFVTLGSGSVFGEVMKKLTTYMPHFKIMNAVYIRWYILMLKCALSYFNFKSGQKHYKTYLFFNLDLCTF